eukprot:TRINITY_DN30671_c0_g1_i1.p2 TRINITY_DN30671_c0_g1~~TRINITY_DN30671_c0_g1_i1.p2  ORF type:complete len:369 (+),score=123.08 TRINITY_DN30671_c0_g1_i1:45-1151(+)
MTECMRAPPPPHELTAQLVDALLPAVLARVRDEVKVVEARQFQQNVVLWRRVRELEALVLGAAEAKTAPPEPPAAEHRVVAAAVEALGLAEWTAAPAVAEASPQRAGVRPRSASRAAETPQQVAVRSSPSSASPPPSRVVYDETAADAFTPSPAPPLMGAALASPSCASSSFSSPPPPSSRASHTATPSTAPPTQRGRAASLSSPYGGAEPSVATSPPGAASPSGVGSCSPLDPDAPAASPGGYLHLSSASQRCLGRPPPAPQPRGEWAARPQDHPPARQSSESPTAQPLVAAPPASPAAGPAPGGGAPSLLDRLAQLENRLVNYQAGAPPPSPPSLSSIDPHDLPHELPGEEPELSQPWWRGAPEMP